MKALIVANWKMNPASFKEASNLLEVTKKSIERTSGVSIVVAPPALYLRELRASYNGKKISFAAQNAHAEDGGAHTGEISMKQAKDAHASYVIVGHAERRASGETNEDTKKKIASALTNGLQPIFCIGETSRGVGGEYYDDVREQIRVGIADVSPQKLSKIIFAYEPVWAIGATTAMNPRDMHEMAIFIRKTVVEIHGGTGHGIKILYGGAIEDKNAADMLLNGDVDGFLVGRASSDKVKVALLLEAIGS